MSLPLFVMRPEPGLSQTLDQARQAGLDGFGEPLSEIRPCAWDVPSPEGFDGVLFGSANAIRHGGEGLRGMAGLAAYCMGESTAQAALAAGFPIAANGRGGMQAMLDSLAGRKLRLLRISGADRVELDPPEGISIETRIAYRQALLPLGEASAERLRGGAVALLYSATMAAHFAAECDRLGIDRGAISLACIGPRVAEAAGEGWARLRSAQKPDGNALLALARDMCQ